MGRRLTIRMLGGFGVEVDGDPVAPEAWRQRRAAAVVKLLATGSTSWRTAAAAR